MTRKKSSLDEVLEYRKTAAAERRDQDAQAWQTWKSDPTPTNLDSLMGRFDPVFRAKAQMWKAPTVNNAAFLTNMRLHAVDAFNTYDPSRGAALRTWVEHRIQPAKRFNIAHQNRAYMPEDQANAIGRIDRARDELTEELNRQPTPREIAQRANTWITGRNKLNARRVERIIENQRKDLSESAFEADPTGFAMQRDEEVMRHLRPTLSPDQQVVYDHLRGVGGKPPITSTTQLAQVLGKSPSQISRLRTGIYEQAKKYR